MGYTLPLKIEVFETPDAQQADKGRRGRRVVTTLARRTVGFVAGLAMELIEPVVNYDRELGQSGQVLGRVLTRATSRLFAAGQPLRGTGMLVEAEVSGRQVFGIAILGIGRSARAVLDAPERPRISAPMYTTRLFWITPGEPEHF